VSSPTPKHRLLIVMVLVGVLTSGCYGFWMPDTDSAPAGCQGKRVLLVGDSLMIQASPVITEQMHQLGYEVEVATIAHGGANAVEYLDVVDHPPEWATPRDELRWWVDNWHPDIVVINWGINMIWSMWGTDWGFLMDWATDTAMNDARRIVQDGGAQLFWTTIPRRDDGFWESVWAANVNDNHIVPSGVPLIDWRQALDREDGTFDVFLRYHEDDQTRPVRTEDRLHFTPDGSDRVARWTTDVLGPEACR
jgi:hypothetical protein